MEFLTILIIFLSGIGAGIMTGLIGASAVTFMAGIFAVFLGYPAYVAIGISLATDVFASLTSTIIYKKFGKIRIKRGLVMAFFATIFAFVGGFFSQHISDTILKEIVVLISFIVGIDLIRKPLNIQFYTAKKKHFYDFFREHKIFSSIFFGILIGLVCGIFGAGGGLFILVILTIILGIDFKSAVGTSVLIMIFIALAGAVGHFTTTPIPFLEIGIASIGGIIGAIIATFFANKAKDKTVSITAGVILILVGLTMLLRHYIF
jgi:hypothetical protein